MRIGILILTLLVLTVIPRALPVFGDAFHVADTALSRTLGSVLNGRAPEVSVAQAVRPYEPVLVPQRTTSTSVGGSISDRVQAIWNVLVPVSVFMSLLLFMGAVYFLLRTHHVRTAAARKYYTEPELKGAAPVVTAKKRMWDTIVQHAQSQNENDWRQAIMEADIMLDELLDAQGYRGETMGDKLKQVERSDFLSIDLAWEAHKVRNKIAHEGSAHSLSEREVRRVIALYEQVFKEFHYV